MRKISCFSIIFCMVIFMFGCKDSLLIQETIRRVVVQEREGPRYLEVCEFDGKSAFVVELIMLMNSGQQDILKFDARYVVVFYGERGTGEEQRFYVSKNGFKTSDGTAYSLKDNLEAFIESAVRKAEHTSRTHSNGGAIP